jgi:glutathione peroxidase
MFEKIDVNGENEHPIYTYLKQQKPGFLGSKKIKWNFTKFLINKQGDVVKRFGSTTKPQKLVGTIEKLL